MEKSKKGGRPEILNFLLDLCSLKPPYVFKVLIASRPDNDIWIHLNDYGYISLQDANLLDIKTVIIKGLNNLSETHKTLEGKLDRVRDDLIDRCEGMFL
jgi:hypothetical protein